MKHELAISILEEKLNLAKKCRDLKLTQFAQTMFRDRDIEMLNVAIEVLKRERDFNLSGSEIVRVSLMRFKQMYGTRVLQNKFTTEEHKLNAYEVITKINSALRELQII